MNNKPRRASIGDMIDKFLSEFEEKYGPIKSARQGPQFKVGDTVQLIHARQDVAAGSVGEVRSVDGPETGMGSKGYPYEVRFDVRALNIFRPLRHPDGDPVRPPMVRVQYITFNVREDDILLIKSV